MNETINLLQNHSSVRKFKNKPLTDEQVNHIFKSANQASSFSLLQAVSIIRITDEDTRKAIMELSGPQSYIQEASEFWIFVSDFNRNHQIAPNVDITYTEFLQIGAVDVGLMAQNAMIAAESMGLGGVYIGGVRLNIEKLSELLELPKYVIPLVGLCIGYPAEEKAQLKPRLPKEVVMHHNKYEEFSLEDIEDYDQEMKKYYENRPIRAPFTAKKVKGWSDHIDDHLERSIQPNMLSYLNKQGYAVK
ncbi:nitroreductase NfsA [Mammaliicoccus lentus]|uniref:oxygen-insensitive NADPH nitroreductase n=1 Tax=Mammaliicoccus TaxID=2803850 RepID=UPI00085CBFB2|nr:MULTISPECIES: oxygen-insensitive NADPH nitroreductase [Mammaliicoccus]HIS18830.1 oxygen-insensitive NADPH nitroreductase [Candidatus Coprovivens excrementavium]MBF0748608.1 oxygen-insensitive NADPH nitroreductase [Mammaliicoccus lentus]MBW0769376.1 oxygen-insensitive NADPH nitroreductase [Mammaliicoccus lentus]MCR1871622.1 oxygen-insensitive NADPH nitroreductase [Mammaliicoccus lentus]TFU58599.1 oxygen-insensitive NADPH nitroreductase [Mammaliicoccus lentus]